MIDFMLSINNDGDPIIVFRHHDKSNDLSQLLLGRFVKLAKEKGLELANPSGYLNTDGDSHENYQIKISK